MHHGHASSSRSQALEIVFLERSPDQLILKDRRASYQSHAILLTRGSGLLDY